MNDEHLDRLLTDAGERWRSVQSAPPEPDVDGWRTRPPLNRWVAVSAAAAIAVVLAGLIGLTRHDAEQTSTADSGQTSPTSTARPTAGSPPVPFLDAPVSGDPVPLVATGDGARGYVSNPPCHGGMSVTARKRSADPGTVTVTVSRIDGARCVLSGPPVVSVLDGTFASADVAWVPTTGGDYPYPVTVGLGGVAVSRVVLSPLCDPQGRELLVRIMVPGLRGTESVGFGAPRCAPGQRPGISVSRFEQSSPPDGVAATAFTGLRAQVDAPADVRGGDVLRLTVTLTAPRDVPLAPCPAHRIGVYDPDSGKEQDHRLNCAAVAGQMLPAGVPVRFEVETAVPADFSGDGKLVWELLTPDRVAVMAPVHFG